MHVAPSWRLALVRLVSWSFLRRPVFQLSFDKPRVQLGQRRSSVRVLDQTGSRTGRRENQGTVHSARRRDLGHKHKACTHPRMDGLSVWGIQNSEELFPSCSSRKVRNSCHTVPEAAVPSLISLLGGADASESQPLHL